MTGEPGLWESQKTALPLADRIALFGTNKSVFFVPLAKRVYMKSACHPQACLGKWRELFKKKIENITVMHKYTNCHYKIMRHLKQVFQHLHILMNSLEDVSVISPGALYCHNPLGTSLLKQV